MFIAESRKKKALQAWGSRAAGPTSACPGACTYLDLEFQPFKRMRRGQRAVNPEKIPTETVEKPEGSKAISCLVLSLILAREEWVRMTALKRKSHPPKFRQSVRKSCPPQQEQRTERRKNALILKSLPPPLSCFPQLLGRWFPPALYVTRTGLHTAE